MSTNTGIDAVPNPQPTAMINLGLSRITKLLQPLYQAHPNKSPWKAIHIAGTNGKGSVAALISSFLTFQGHKVGRFTSPHLIDRWDCITIGEPMGQQEPVLSWKFAQAEKHFIERSETHGMGASNFEILTASAYQLFADEGVDFAVVECGLGGRLDATNVLRDQDVCVSVLTKVGLDHVEFLGDTMEKITREKAGIFRKGVPVVVDGSNVDAVMGVVMERLDELDWNRTESGSDGLYVSSEERDQTFNDIVQQLGLAKHQTQNLYTAWSAFKWAVVPPTHRSQQSEPSETSKQHNNKDLLHMLPALIRQAHASLPGRLQHVTLPTSLLPASSRPAPQILLDGAHNLDSAHALSAYISASFRHAENTPMTFLLAMKADKDIDGILKTLLRDGDNVVTCEFGDVDGMPWVQSISAKELASKVQQHTSGTVESINDDQDSAGDGVPEDKPERDRHKNEMTKKALQRATSLANEVCPEDGQAQLCITGSLYLVGDVLRYIRDSQASQPDS